MSFTRTSARGSDVLLIDGSRIDTASLHRGSKDAIDRFISFLREAGEAVDAFEGNSRNASKMIALCGFMPPPEFMPDAGEAWILDELLSRRQSLREALIASRFWKVPSLFLGHGDCASPVMEIVRMCRMRLWLDAGSVFRGTPGHWAFGLMGVDPFNGASTYNGAVMAPWEISVEGAQKIGFLDACLDFDPESHVVPALIDRFAPLLQGRVRLDPDDSRRSGDPGFRDLLARHRQKFGRFAEGSSRNLLDAMAKTPSDFAGAELAAVYLGMNQSRQIDLTLTKVSNGDLPVFGPQVFGLAVDLSEGVLAPGFLMELARRKGFIFMSASQTAHLPSRLEAQKVSLAARLGSTKAQAFWDRNVIPCAAGSVDSGHAPLPVIRPRGTDSITLDIPGEGRWLLDLLPGLAEASASLVDAWKMMPAVVRSSASDSPCSDDSDWLGRRPGLTEILRVFTGGVIFSQDFKPAGFRSLFHYLLACNTVRSGWVLEDAWKELIGNGWLLDPVAPFRKTLEIAGMTEVKGPGREQKFSVPLPAINIYARALGEWMADAMGKESGGKSLLRRLTGIPAFSMVVMSGDDKPPVGLPVHLLSEEPVIFFPLSPKCISQAGSGISSAGVEIPGEFIRKKSLEKYFQYTVMQMPQRLVDAVSKTTQLPATVWVKTLAGE